LKKLHRALIEQVVSLIFLLLVFYIANRLSPTLANSHYDAMLEFTNANFWLVLAAFIFIGLGEVFHSWGLPYAMVYPVCTSIGSALAVQFIFFAFGMIDSYTQMVIFGPLAWLRNIMSFTVFVLVLVLGYVRLNLQNLPNNQTGSSGTNPGPQNQNPVQKAKV